VPVVLFVITCKHVTQKELRGFGVSVPTSSEMQVDGRSSMHRSYQSVADFLQESGDKLHKIAGRRSYALDELEQIAWVIALDIERERGFQIDFADPEVRGEILRAVEAISRRDRRRRSKNISLDQPLRNRNGEGDACLLDFIEVGDEADPVQAWMEEEDREERQSRIAALCADSYSEFSGYVFMLSKFDFVMDEAALHLALAVATLVRRIRAAYLFMRAQPSLFDQVAVIASDFLPPRRIAKLLAPRVAVRADQLSLALA